MAFTYYKHPHHIHREVNCSNHAVCGESHWEGGKPQIDWPHHVEIDCSTGLVGYTRLTPTEIAEKEGTA